MIHLNPTAEDATKIADIVSKASAVALAVGGHPIDRLQFSISLTACHLNGCPLDLDGLLNTDQFNLMHDVCGIHQHINHEDGSLSDFRPRFSASRGIPDRLIVLEDLPEIFLKDVRDQVRSLRKTNLRRG